MSTECWAGTFARNQTAVAMVVCAAATGACALLTQATHPSPRALLNGARPLTSTEIETILSASRKALTARTFLLASNNGNQGPEVLMGHAGQPKLVRWAGAVHGGSVGGAVETHWRREFVKIIDYTGRPARGCAESAEQGELVVEYELVASTKTWMTTARQRDARDFGGLGIAPIFDMLQSGAAIASGERRLIGDRWARVFISPWKPPRTRIAEQPLIIGDPIPNVVGEPAPGNAVQSLWIDSDSLLPLRWEASKYGTPTYGYNFRYRPIELRRPAGVDSPVCIR